MFNVNAQINRCFLVKITDWAQNYCLASSAGRLQYHGLLVYTDGGDISVGWITAGTQKAMNGGRYMTMIIYREEINMTIVSHVLGAQMIDTSIAAGVVNMLDDENGYGDRIYETVQDMASTTWALLEPHHMVEHQATKVLREMADPYETFREQGGPSCTTLPTTMSDRINDVSFRFVRDPTKKWSALALSRRQTSWRPRPDLTASTPHRIPITGTGGTD